MQTFAAAASAFGIRVDTIDIEDLSDVFVFLGFVYAPPKFPDNRGLAPGSLYVIASALRDHHLRQRLDIAWRSAPYFTGTLRAIRRLKGHRRKQKLPFTLDLLHDLFDVSFTASKTLRLAVLAAVCVGFFAGLRVSELLFLRVSHVVFHYSGGAGTTPTHVTLAVPKSKNHFLFEGRTRVLGRTGDGRICPVLLLHRLLRSGAAPPARKLFHGVTRGTIAAALKLTAVRAGIPSEAYGTHSLRRGFAQAALDAGVRQRLDRIGAALQAGADWRSDCYKQYPRISPADEAALTRQLFEGASLTAVEAAALWGYSA